MSAASSVVISALTEDQVKKLPLIAVAAVILVGLLLIKLVTSMVMRIVTLIAMLVIAPSLWVQRGKALDQFNKLTKSCDATFFGIHVDSSDPRIKQACDTLGKIPANFPSTAPTK